MEGTASRWTFPLCFRFYPTGEEIIHYLHCKVYGLPLPSDAVRDCDLYGESSAWKRLFEETGEKVLYFFTKLKKKTQRGSRIERVTSCGTWRCQTEKNVYNDAGEKRHHIGYKRSFTFVPDKKNMEEKGRWVMHEYRLHETLQKNSCNDVVVCCVIRKPTRKLGQSDHNTQLNNVTETALVPFGESNDLDSENQGITVEELEEILNC